MFKHTIALVGLSVLTFSANAALYDRGGGMIYDDTKGITWLQDANYAATQFTATNGLKGDADGKMNSTEARIWADGLNYGGFDDWRMPSIEHSMTEGNNPHGELGHMFYNNLGNYVQQANGSLNVSFTDSTPGAVGTKSFSNVKSARYWYKDSEHATNTKRWTFLTTEGAHEHSDWKNLHYAWAVRDGDVNLHALPVPEAGWLLGTALLGLAGLKRGYR